MCYWLQVTVTAQTKHQDMLEAMALRYYHHKNRNRERPALSKHKIQGVLTNDTSPKFHDWSGCLRG